MSDPGPSHENLRAEYGALSSYVTAMTGMRFQTLAIYLAAIGLIVSGGAVSSLNALLILVVSFGLWVLDLRNRDILWRLGERGQKIERIWGELSSKKPEEASEKGGAGFFLDSGVPPRVRLLTLDPLTISKPLSPWSVTHALAIDVVFLGVIGYAIALLAGADDWPWLLTALGPLVVGIAFVSVVRRRSKQADRRGQRARRGSSSREG